MTIERGTRVRVVMLHSDYFPDQPSPSFEATYNGGPYGAGDTANLTLDDGRELMLNLNSDVFVGMHPVAVNPKGA